MPTHDERVASYLRAFEGRVLEVVAENERLQCVILRSPGQIAQSTVITAGPGHIHIAGDLCPARGVTYHTGDTTRMFGWFAGASSPSYLAEKFLREGWDRERAIRDATHALTDVYGDPWTTEQLQEIRELIQRLEGGDFDADQRAVAETMSEVGTETADGLWGDGYDPRDLACLCAIQQQFSQLWRAHKQDETSEAA